MLSSARIPRVTATAFLRRNGPLARQERKEFSKDFFRGDDGRALGSRIEGRCPAVGGIVRSSERDPIERIGENCGAQRLLLGQPYTV